MNNNIITFQAQSLHVFNVREKPAPAVNFIPSWWKEIPKYSNLQNKLDLDPGATITVKQCAPTLDMLSLGYIIPLWSDILVTQTESGPQVKWASSIDVLDMWSPAQSQGFEVPQGFSPLVFKYLHGWNIITKKGWSTMFIHPVGYQNLPIRSIGGVVDTDILKTDINCPFFIRNDFEGIIPKGTPMAQIIPFKRENWQSEYTILNANDHFFETEKLKTKLYGYYSSKRARKNFK